MADPKLLKLIRRRHPEYDSTLPHWLFLEACYKGGRAWFPENIFKYIKEGEVEYKDRIDRAYRFNHSKEVVDLVDKYLFKAEIKRNIDKAPQEVKDFWEKSTKFNLDINQFVRQISRKSSIYGSVWVVIDSSRAIDGDEIISVAEARELGNRIYGYTVTPDRALDMGYDEDGDLNWILIYEQQRDDSDPFESSGDYVDNYRLWTRNEWFLFEKRASGATVNVTQIDYGKHNLGVVPVFRVDNQISDEKWSAPSLIGDIAYLDKAVANYLSNLDAIIQDQTFSQLAMPAQGLMPGEDDYNKMVEMGTKRIFLYDGERGGEPKYIAPDPKQANVILGVISKIINEIYHTVGMAGERTKQDNAVGIDNSSGVAKAFDFERVNALLVSKAASLEMAEKHIIGLIALWSGNTVTASDVNDLVEYNKSFDVRGLFDEFEIAARLSLIEAPDAMRREQMRGVSEKLFTMVSDEVKKDISRELKSWPPAPEPVLPSGPSRSSANA